MLFVELSVVLLAIWLGSRLGSIGIGYAGGLGVLVLAMLGLTPGHIPTSVILIIMSVISVIAAMQVAGGMDYLVKIAERIIRKNPKQITFIAPLVTYGMTLLAGTGHTAFSTMPVITEVAKEQGIRPSRPLSIAVVASQIAITASPISAAVVALTGILAPLGVDYLSILAVSIPASLAAVLLTAFVANRQGVELDEDPVYQQRLAEGLVRATKADELAIKPGAKRAVGIFLFSIFAIVVYATAISDSVGLIENPVMARDQAIMILMLSAAAVITLVCKVDTGQILGASTFKAGMSACICVLGVAWLGDTFVSAHIDTIKEVAGELVRNYAWLLAVALFFASMLLYSQAAATVALMPAAVAMGVEPLVIVASFAAVSALFVLPTYPTLLAAVEMDDTGSTRIGKYVFNHPFLLPGVVAITLAVAFGFAIGSVVL
ncbi:anaerobic c4-dicarboxylate antiporter, Dcu family [Ferrimonas balearica DSM 9799]|uniref:C4-dicarboxylate transporter n=1 Tax=Ferrimonas balearica (strain DSM 9799 / CCM 4581 / KCTC 23876 / PAT) TaxID=550540 RepID=E1STV4_FERBD|nr:anaerobic C4-dicarboxylate transporter [Ferrimonas balearica]ADN77198.1 anaerobic c4-dicarboxylate antiporter, Dcu family [Ferrimonas balearica DSM 9799]